MEKTEAIEISKQLLAFIDNSPSQYHVIKNFAEVLENAGFKRLSESETWNITEEGMYYVTRSDSSIIAFKMPKTGEISNFQITAAHSDSPVFKIKENPEMAVENAYLMLNTEKYGGMLMAPWFDRPLSVAGRVVVKDGDTFATRLVDIDRDLLIIPNLAIHMNREANDGYKYNPQKDMLPLAGAASDKGVLRKLLAAAAGVKEESIISDDLFLYNREKGTIIGLDDEYIAGGRLDDLMCAYAGIKALVESRPQDRGVKMCAVFDNEEVGSTTKQGADSTFLQDVLERIAEASGLERDGFKRAIASSFMLSADNAHAVHPNHTDKADPTNRPYVNGGVVIKFNANQKYTTDAVSAAIFKEICDRAQVPYQTYVNRSDIAGGSTLGNIANSHVSLNTVDIGLAQLAMHSPYETAGVMDTDYMIRAVKTFYETQISCNADGSYSIG